MSHLFRGRDFITTQDYEKEEIDIILDLARELKVRFAHDDPTPWLLHKTLFMLFFDASTRTRNSIEAGMTQMGGHAHFLAPDTLQLSHGETITDTAKILCLYGHGIAIRACSFLQGNQYMKAMANSSDVPVLNLQDDVYHPMQVLADLMTIQERFGKDVRDLKVGITWAYAESHLKPLSVPQSQLLLFTRYGMDITLAYPQGFDLMPEIMQTTHENADQYGARLTISHEMDAAFDDADVVIAKNWGGFYAADTPERIQEVTRRHKDWICNEDRMRMSKSRAIYMHALPADRGKEVTDAVIDGPQSVVYPEAANRLHTAKAVMALLMGGR